jgi:carbon-monoxide dehydrogenase medium subunit
MSLYEARFHTPQTLNEALKLLAELEQARILAGGTDLLVDLKQGLARARNLISLQEIKELKEIIEEKNRIKIGAMVTAQNLILDPLIIRSLPALVDAARSMASFQIRSMATIGGNISSAVPSADLPPSLMAAEARVELRCLDSSREVLLSSFFSGPRKTVCGEREVLTFIRFPLLPPKTGVSYQKLALREANSLAVASVAVRITIVKGKIAEAALVLGAVAPTPVLAAKASRFLIGKEPSGGLFARVAQMAKEECHPISDIRGSFWFRKELVEVLTRRALAEASEKAWKKSEKGNQAL